MFRQDTTCPALLTLIYYALTYTRVSLCPLCLSMQFYLNILYFWALSRSLAATWEISVDFFSSGYWDVSLPLVRFYTLRYSWHCCRVSPFGYLRLLRPLSACLSFSQISTSFFASWRHGIHHVRLFTWPYNPGLLLVVCSLLPENILSRNLLVKTFSFTQWLIEFEFLYSACF